MKPVQGIVSAVSELIGRLTLPAREKKQLETDLLKVFIFYRNIFHVEFECIFHAIGG